ncbi:MAG: hypothetical protein DMG30_04330 [Acidobacteria bacterium]|nr:MAG: hypothetical protein DMG30_04330 [Acidobacteriota bacterium]
MQSHTLSRKECRNYEIFIGIVSQKAGLKSLRAGKEHIRQATRRDGFIVGPRTIQAALLHKERGVALID